MTKIYFSPKTKQGDLPLENILEVIPFTKNFVPSKMNLNRPSWFTKLNRDDFGHMTQCPSFINIMNVGYVVRSIADIYVTQDNGEIKLESNYKNIASGISDKFPFDSDIDIHTQNQFCDRFPFEEGFVPMSLKFASPFVFMPEETLQVMFFPCWWHEGYKYIRAYHGLIQHHKNEPVGYEINTAIRIPSEQSYCIPSGTPLAQLVPCNIKQVEFSLVDKPSSYKKIMQSKLGARLTRYVSMNSQSPIKRIKSFLVSGDNK